MLTVQPNARANVDQCIVHYSFYKGNVLMELLSTLNNKSPLNCPSSSTPHSTFGLGDSLLCRVQSSKGHADAGLRLYDWREHLRRGPSITCPKPETNPGISAQPHPRRKQQAEEIPVSHFDPSLNGHEPTEADIFPPNEDTDFFHEILPETRAELLHTVNDLLPTSRSSLLSTPDTQTSLYRNLLYLINVRKPTASLPSLVEYHRRYTAYQSTRSYNLLLDLSLRHRQYGITEH